MNLGKNRKDELFLEKLELMDDYIVQKHQLEKLVKSGCLYLAKARYVDKRPNYISTLQLPSCDTDKEVRALYNVNLVEATEELDQENDTNKENIKKPVNKNNEKKEYSKNENGHSNDTNKDAQFQLIKHQEGKNNPLRWFGVLVSLSLRSAQKDFQKCIDLTIDIANIQLKLQRIETILKDHL